MASDISRLGTLQTETSYGSTNIKTYDAVPGGPTTLAKLEVVFVESVLKFCFEPFYC